MNIIYRINDVTIFIPSLCKLQAAEKEIKLSNKEAELLDRLCQKAGSIVLRHELLEFLWPRQDSANASLNRVVSSLRRKFDSLGHGNVVETFPRVGYLVSADIVIISQDEYQQENNDIQAHTTEKRHLFYGWTTAIITAFSIFTFLLTDNKSHTPVLPELISEHIKSTSVYIVKNSFKDEKSIIMDTLKHISKSIHFQDNHLSLLIGKKTISYISMNNKNKNTINRVYLIKDNQSIHEQISCITNELIRLNKNEKSNHNINNAHVKIYFYSECGQDANYVETDQQRKVINNKNNNLIFATITGLDKESNILFKLHSIGSYDRNTGKARINMEINHFMINVLDQDALINNSLLINIISAYRSAGQTAVYIKLKDGIYYFNYMDGILLPMEI